MNVFLKFYIGLLLVVILTGCIGENYNFSPPTVKLSSDSMIESEELVQANIDWLGEDNTQIVNETKDITTLAKQQHQMYMFAGEEVDLLFEHSDFAPKELSVTFWKDHKELDVKVRDNSFYPPKEKGEYMVEVNLLTDRGMVQYVGNVVIVE